MSLGPLRLDRSDLKCWGLSFGLAFLAAMAIYAAAFGLAPKNTRFSGFLYGAHDHFTYRVWSEAFARGGLLVDNPYASVRRPPAYFNLIWFGLGKLMKLTGLPFLAIYYAFGLLTGGFMYLAVLALMRELIRDRAMAWCAYLLAGFSSGFGWIIVLLSPDFFNNTFKPGDIFYGDTYPLLLFLSAPHMVVSFSLVTLIYLWIYRGTVTGRTRWVFRAGAAALILGFFHPYHYTTVIPVLSLWYLVLSLKYGRRWLGNWLNLLILVTFMLPPLLYFMWLFKANPNFASWESQNVMRTFGWLGVVLGFGPLIILALQAYRGFVPVKAYADRYLLVVLWSFVNFSLLFSFPFIKFEARLVLGLILPLSVLATYGFFDSVLPLILKRSLREEVEAEIMEGAVAAAVSRPPAGKIMRWIVILVFSTMITPVFIMTNQLRYIVTGKFIFQNTSNTHMLIHEKTLEALAFFSKQARDEPVVMSSLEIGLVLPAYTPVRSFLGNFSITPEWRKRNDEVKWFYKESGGSVERRQFLESNGIDFVWWGPHEVELGKFHPVAVPYLSPIFDNGIESIYRVIRAAPG